MSSLEAKINDLLRACNIIAKRLHSYRRVARSLIYTSSLMFIYSLLLISMIFISWNQLYYMLIIFVGFIGSTAIFMYHFIILRRLNSHVEVSKYFHSHIEDMLKMIDLGFSEETYNYLEKLLAIEKIPLEYMPALLIVPYISILIVSTPILALILVIVYLVALSIFPFLSLELFNRHIVYENKITQEVFSKIGSEKNEEYKPYIMKIFDIILSGISLGLYLVILYNKLDAYLDDHVICHRKNYRLFKINYIKKTREYIASTQQ